MKIWELANHPSAEVLRSELLRMHYNKLLQSGTFDAWRRAFKEEYRLLVRAVYGRNGGAFVVTDGMTLEGFLVFALRPTPSGPAGRILAYRVVPHLRGQGIGAVLMSHLLECADLDGWSTVIVEAGTGPAAAAARHVYQRHGFVTSSIVMERRRERHPEAPAHRQLEDAPVGQARGLAAGSGLS